MFHKNLLVNFINMNVIYNIAVVDDVLLNVGRSNYVKGRLSLCMLAGNYRFSFKSAEPIKILKDQGLDDARIIIMLADVNGIKMSTDNIKNDRLIFTMGRKEVEITFLIPHIKSSITEHLLQYLKHKKVIFPEINANRTYRCKLPKVERRFVRGELSVVDIYNLDIHMNVVKKLEENLTPSEKRLTLSDLKEYLLDNGGIQDKDNTLKNKIIKHGLDDESRYKLWPFILDLFPYESDNEQQKVIMEKKINDYICIKKQMQSIVKSQLEECSNLLSMLKTIEADVKRTDRNLPQFKDSSSPYFKVVDHLLTVYGFYNKDSLYVQGMGDLLTPLLLSIIKDINNNVFKLVDGSEVDEDTAEGIVFTFYCYFLDKLKHDRLFVDVSNNVEIELRNIAEYAFLVHRPLKRLIKNNKDLQSVSFVFRSFFLLYKRDFDHSTVLRLWDAFISSPLPHIVPKLYLSSVMIKMYPKFILDTDRSLGEVLTICDNEIQNLNPEEVLQVTYNMIKAVENIQKRPFTEIDKHEELSNFKPRYLNIV